MIGGTDIVVARVFSQDQLAASFRKTWPDLIIENAEGLPGAAEFFFYKNQQAKDVWDAAGAMPEVEDEMIWAILYDHCTAFVVSGLETETGRMVKALVRE